MIVRSPALRRVDGCASQQGGDDEAMGPHRHGQGSASSHVEGSVRQRSGGGRQDAPGWLGRSPYCARNDAARVGRTRQSGGEEAGRTQIITTTGISGGKKQTHDDGGESHKAMNGTQRTLRATARREPCSPARSVGQPAGVVWRHKSPSFINHMLRTGMQAMRDQALISPDRSGTDIGERARN